MADFVRRAKSGSDWTSNELNAYNIGVVRQDAATFFGIPVLPHPSMSPEVFTTLEANQATSDDVHELLRHMDLAMSPPSEKSAVRDFVRLLLRALAYTRRGRILRSRKDIPLVICGERRHAKADMCIIDDDGIMMLVVQALRHMEYQDPEPQLIAEAIAAFAANNKLRRDILNEPPLQSKVIAGITMKGTAPTFYKILVTTELVNSVGGGTFPSTHTIVYSHSPEIPRPNNRCREGMKPLDNRQVILSCYEAFKTFVN